MYCEQARQLFDAYLDGELSPALATELGAHRLRCPECRRSLALLEVAGHLVSTDRDPVTIRRDFANRLLDCMDAPTPRWTQRVRRVVYIAGPLAAAAVIALAFVGVFDRGGGEVAGARDVGSGAVLAPDDPLFVIDESLLRGDEGGPPAAGDGASDKALEAWIEQTRRNMGTKRQSGESLHKVLDLTIMQVMDILEQASDTSSVDDHFPGAQSAAPLEKSEPSPDDGGEREW